jgi:hypothetical protein
MELKPFDNHDWDAWAGAGENAHIAYVNDFVVITDDDGVFVQFGDSETCFALETPNAKTVAKLINFEAISNPLELQALGFVSVC